MMSRRDFLKKAGLIVGGVMAPVAAFEIANPARARATHEAEKDAVRWVYLVDTHKCVGCGFCVKACKLENDIPYDKDVTRTWVERYVLTKDGGFNADSPAGGRDGFVDPRIQIGENEYKTIKQEDIDKAFFVPKLCNHCANPPCVQVCPVGATYQTADGVVLVDRTWCIGCGYCIMACPYGARFFNPYYKTAEKCTFCYHRITKGLEPACVQACPFGARQIGNIKDPNDPVAVMIQTERVGVLKSEFGTKPQVYYVDLDWQVP